MSGSSSVGRVSAFQADRREFESRLPLLKKDSHLVSPFLNGMTERELQVRKHFIEFERPVSRVRSAFAKS